MMGFSDTVIKQKKPISFDGMNVNQVKTELSAQLNDKEKMLGKIGTSQISRNALIKQTDIIRRELLDLNRYQQEDQLPIEVRTKLEDLANEFQYLKSSKSSGLDDSKPAAGFAPLLPPPPTNSSPTKQRTKTVNGNRRNPDIEFATEIGQGLLIEVRKLQTTLQEKEEIIKQLELSQADNERTHETAKWYIKQKEEAEERLKEENWNLAVANEDLRSHLLESSQTVAKYGRLAKQLKSKEEQIEIMKAEKEKSDSVIEAVNARLDQVRRQLKRQEEIAERELKKAQNHADSLITELKICKSQLVMSATSTRVEDNTPSDIVNESTNDQGSDSEQTNQSVPTMVASASQSTRSQALQTETLKQSLAHANRIIFNLRSSCHKEKMEKFEIKKMLADSQENIEQMRKEMANWNTNNSISSGSGRSKAIGKKRAVTKKRRGGVARQPRGLCANESDNDQFSNMKEEDQEEDQEEINSVDKDDDDGDDNESIDQSHFNGTTLDEIFSFNSMPSTSTAMKPLSSELEAKVQVIDAGINTDPVDFGPCMHGDVQQETVTVKQQDSDTRSDPFVPPKDNHVPQINNQEDRLLHSSDNNESSSNDTTKTASIRDMNDNNTSDIAPIAASSTITEVLIQEQIAKALVKERQEIAVRAESILSPEQIETILPSITQLISSPTGERAIASNSNKNIPIEAAAQQQQHTFNTERSTLSTHVISEDMVPQSQVEKLIQVAIAEKTVDMLPKSEVDQIIQVTIAEKTVDMLPKSEVDQIVQVAIAEKTVDMLPKSEVDQIIQVAIAEKTVDMLPKSEVDQIIQVAIAEKTVDMLPKSEVDQIIQVAIAEKTVDMLPKSEVDQLIEVSIAEKTVDMLPKSEVENLVIASNAETRAIVESELREIMVPKIQVNAMIHEAIEKVRAEYKTLETGQETTHSDMVTKAEAESMALVAVAIATEKLKHEAANTPTNTVEEAAIEPLTDLISKEDADALVKQAIDIEKEKTQQQVDSALANALEKQKADLESSKQVELEKLEAIKLADLERQKAEMLTIKQAELEEYKLEMEAVKLAELERQKSQIEADKQMQLEKQKLEIQNLMQAELEKQRAEIEATTMSHLEKQKAEADQANQLEIEALSKKIDSFKKEAKDTNQRMMTMLTKDSADVLVKRAVAEALEAAEKSQAEALAGMISREYANNMVKDEVSKALEAERKEAAQREEIEAMSMISKAEAEALAKVAAADAIVKERQAMAAREKELMTKEEADALAESAAREALDKNASILAQERKALREKEERMITKEEAERNTLEAVRVALLEHRKGPSKKELTTTTLSNMAASSSSSPSSSAEALVEINNRNMSFSSVNTTHVPTRLSQLQSERPVAGKNELMPPSTIERSVSTSRLALPSVNVSPAPSVSTPASTSRKLRLSSSVSSLRLGSGRKENGIQKSQRPSTDGTTSNNTMPFGTFRILESTKYNGGSSRLHSKSSLSLRELSNNHSSSISVSTMSSNEEHHSASGGRIPMPMSSDENFPGFSNNSSTDIFVISAITQTMIGEWMSKHTRRYVGGGISENKHQRFFWVHPYTRILYWSSVQPGAEGNEAKTKSAFIESVSEVSSHDISGGSPMSLLIRTPKRDLKITAPSLERHQLWFKSLCYLLGRPNNSSNNQIIEEPRLTSDSSAENVAQHQQSNVSISSKASEKSMNHVSGSTHLSGSTQYDSDDSDDSVNIRQCCDGKHDVSTLTRGQHHNH